MYKCKSCNKKFRKPELSYIYDPHHERGKYLVWKCPKCKSEKFEEVKK